MEDIVSDVPFTDTQPATSAIKSPRPKEATECVNTHTVTSHDAVWYPQRLTEHTREGKSGFFFFIISIVSVGTQELVQVSLIYENTTCKEIS